VAAHTGGHPPWHDSRPLERRISSPYRQATSPRQVLQVTMYCPGKYGDTVVLP
jgi:hypothetical protein